MFEREGMYYALVRPSLFEEPIEVALHGVVSEDQARAALEVLSPSRGG